MILNPETLFTIPQLIGFVAFIIGVTAFLQKEDKRFKVILGCQAYTLCIHFLLIGAYSGAAMTFITGTRNFLSLKANLKKIIPLFIILILLSGYFSYQNWLDLFPILSGCIATIALFYTQGILMRSLFCLTSSLWIVHNIGYASVGPAIMESFIVISNLFTIWRLRKEKNDTKTA